jgi:hypothetical protein
MGHIHHDSGSILLGHKGVWWIDDPGYQQYLKTSEREFTIGTFAHNAPIINGQAQVVSAASFSTEPLPSPEIGHVTVDMTACYAAELRLTRATRSAWLLRDAVVLCDVIAAAEPVDVRYAWHGLPAAGWWVEDGKALIEHDATELWLQTSHDVIRPACVKRLRGSRGHLSLMISLPPASESVTCWWVFSFGSRPASFATDNGALSIGDIRLRAPASST